MEEKELKVNYLCDGKVKGCSKRACYRNRKDDSEPVCRHTKDIRYAKNFHRPYPQSNYFEQNDLQDTEKEIADVKRIMITHELTSAAVALILISILYILRYRWNR